MLKFIIILILSFVIASFLDEMLHIVEHGNKPIEVAYKVTATPGIIGCLSKEKFNEIAQYSANKNYDAMKKVMAEGYCFTLAKGEEISGLQGSCGTKDGDRDLFAFKSKKIVSGEIYLPCFSVR